MMIARAIFVWTLLLSQAISENSKISFLREFSIEHGYFFQSGNTVDIYTMDSERSITRRISRNTKETVLVFSHNHYTLLDGSWHLTFHDTTNDPKNYLDLEPCDGIDQIDLSQVYPNILALIGDSKIKADRKIVAGIDLVLFSKQERGDISLQAALVDVDFRSRKPKKIIETINMGSNTYCGHRLVSVIGQKRKYLLFVYFHENGGGPTDIMIVKSYMIYF